ncbi:hypothetical protein RHMOL_Rhmol02G0306500 [Rhododendron molle]|uniref:Uncharacterized protein n=1 Tax=Rhododendron molle TaxID=49168 RepID=A0ACC0PVV3_RHOML|nr:hypothetical protein RHMOL_Rhmol02G0306500 [Rhododendron molle]
MASLISETIPRFTAEALRAAAKQSEGCHVVHVRLRRAIKRYLREQEDTHMRRKVLSLSQSLNEIKDVNLMLTASTSKELVEDPLKSVECSKRWKIKSSYGDIGLKYREDQTVAYVASRMPAVYSACYRVLSEVCRRLPGFSPTRVLDFGAGTGSAMWAVREVWPRSLERINLVEPSQSMQRAGQSLIKNLKNLPLIHSYDSIQSLTKNINKSERDHDLVIAKRRKSKGAIDDTSKDLMTLKSGAFVVAPCTHDGRCPLDNTGKYCHFVQRLQRTTSQRVYKGAVLMFLTFPPAHNCLFRSPREGSLYVVLKMRSSALWLSGEVNDQGKDPWPLDGMKFDTLKEQHAKRNPEDLEIDYEDQFESIEDQFESEAEDVPYGDNPISYDSDIKEADDDIPEDDDEEEEEENKEETASADLGPGWGRIIEPPVRRGRLVELNVCRAANPDGSEGALERIVVTQSKNPTLHKQARRSFWGDLWPFSMFGLGL